MSGILRILNSLAKLSGVLAMMLLAAATLVVTQMVFSRYILGASTVWQTEFVIYATTAAMMLGSPYVLALKGHVGVDLLVEAAGPGLRRVFALISGLASLAFVGALAWSGFEFLYHAASRGWTTDTIWALPLWIPFWPVPFAMALMALQLILQTLIALTGGELEVEGPVSAGTVTGDMPEGGR
ncbi:TRAP transporter small permease [Paracoccus sp. TK19116]|uniref:TRAP transporter small permease protein n=1 Tax=Paracoccus albicereus TaxID=2922394 RepID=A0ABT1MTM5_9RHOB|nr:TRAP transporter small permease [Paracoccus albicereus]MCQ0970216.1 TRAP transporter small permease [Paracoccus albicereus]